MQAPLGKNFQYPWARREDGRDAGDENPRRFARIHRSTIVNMKRLAPLHRTEPMIKLNTQICWLLALLSPFATLAAAQSSDPILGKWYGMGGPQLDRVPIGFEFKLNERGEIKAYLSLPVANFYNFELPGVAVRDSGKYQFADVALTVAVDHGKLVGTYLWAGIPLTLERTARLPRELPVPAYPRGPGPVWMAKLGGAIYAPVAVRDSVAYVGTTGGIMNAIHVRDGTFAWTFVAGRPLHGEPLATENHLYFVCDNGYLFKLDRRTGKEVWRYDLGDARVSRPLGHQVLPEIGIGAFDFDQSAPRPLLVDSILYVGSGDGSFHAVNANTGVRVWRFEANGKIRSDAASDGVRVFFGSFDHIVYAVDRESGKEVWRKDTQAEVTSSPVLIGDRLIVGNRGGLLAALNPATGTTIWRMLFWSSSVESTPVPGPGSEFFIGSSDLRRVSRIDAKDGRVLWRSDIYGIAWGRPAVTDHMVYASAVGNTPYAFMRHLGGLSALDPATGKTAWRWPVPDSGALYTGFNAAPVVAGDRLIVGGLDGNLYGFSIRR